jgi:hypothetical protein
VRLLEAGSWKLEAISDSSLHTASAFARLRELRREVFVVGKNYRLQDIQL